jgi:branched-chain amino acid aminotransferase
LDKKGNTLYIRPFMIATGEGVIANPSDEYKFMIILSPAKSYYSGEVKVLMQSISVEQQGGIGAAKLQVIMLHNFTTSLANEAGFQQVIWTDDATHKTGRSRYNECFFQNKYFIYCCNERILGITRSLIDMAKKKVFVLF